MTLNPNLEAGDANRDFRFDPRDVVQLLQAGKYGSVAEAYWSEGDFNGDRLFDAADLAAALAQDHYQHGPYFSALQAEPDTFDTVAEDSRDNALDVLANDRPSEGGQLAITSVTSPDRGGVVQIENGQLLRYTPAPDFSGIETFGYTVNDGDVPPRSTTVTVHVRTSNDAPRFTDASQGLVETLVLDGTQYGWSFGTSTSGTVDVNGDGLTDIIVGGAAMVPVFSGLDGSLLFTLDASQYAGYGTSASGAGDVNGDGLDDVILGIYTHNRDGLGLAQVYSGADGSLLYAFTGESTEDLFGFSVDGAGDVNGDGRADVLVGAPKSCFPASAVRPTSTRARTEAACTRSRETRPTINSAMP